MITNETIVRTVNTVVGLFSGSKSMNQVTFWWLACNGDLGGARPCDVILTDPSAVVTAAEAELLPIDHG